MRYCSACGTLQPDPPHKCDPGMVERWTAFAKKPVAESVPGLIPSHVVAKLIAGKL